MNALCRVRTPRFAAVVLSSLCVVPFGQVRTVRAQDAPPNVVPKTAAPAREANPEGVTLTVRTKDGRTRFRQGEVVGLELSFSSAIPDAFRFWPGLEGGYRRDACDTFHVSPRTGTVDPLDDYFRSRYGPRFFGGPDLLRPKIGKRPITLDRDLNEWVRFDRPGRYEIYVASNRVSRVPADANDRGNFGRVSLTSNTVTIEIAPASARWQADELSRITKALGGGGEAARREALVALRFLGSKAAAEEMARRTAGGEDHFLGLAGSPERAAGVREMERLIDAPTASITPSFMHDLTSLKLFERRDFLALLEESAEHSEEARRDNIMRREALASEVEDAYTAQLAAALATKTSAARAVALSTLVTIGDGDTNRSSRAALVAAFAELPAAAQRDLLNHKWDRIAGPDMLPVLRGLHDSLPDSDEETRSAVLERLIALDPEDGRERVIEEVRRRSSRVSPSVFAGLPDATIPALDGVLGMRLTGEDISAPQLNETAALVARFGSPALLPLVTAAYDSGVGHESCAARARLLAYLLKTEPSAGAARLREAIAAREQTPCVESLLGDVAKIFMCPEIERLAVELLDDPDPHLVADAAATLCAYGSPAAEQFIWNRFEALSARRRNKPLIPDYGYGMEENAAYTVERGLIKGLADARSWALGPQKRVRLESLCVSALGKRMASEMVRETVGGVQISYSGLRSGWGEIWIARYSCRSPASARERLAQFPRGTHFVWTEESSPRADAVFAELGEWLEQNGMEMIRNASVR